MKNFLRVLCAAAITLLFLGESNAQFQTPAIDGTISGGEYANSSGVWSMTWDATYLYIAKTGGVASEPIIVYLDVDPIAPVSGGSSSNGDLVGNTDYGVTPILPFRGDVRIYWKPSATYIEFKTRGGWSTTNSSSGDIFQSSIGTTREMRIRWAALPGLSGIPSSLNWFGYETSEAIPGYWYDQTPSENPSGAVASQRVFFYYTVSSTGNGGSTNPFSQKSFETRGDYGYASPTPIFDMTINDPTNFLRITGNISIAGSLFIGSNSQFRADGASRTMTFTGTNGSITNSGTMYGEYSSNTMDFIFNGTTTLNSDIDIHTVTVNAGKTLNCQTNKISSNSAGGAVTVNGTLKTSNTNGFSGSSSTTINNTNIPSITIGASSTIEFSSASAQTISARSDYANITISGGSDKSVGGSTTISGTLQLTTGDVALNGNIVTLGSSATLVETGGRVKGGTGTIATTRSLNAPTDLNVAGLGAEITTAANLGSTTITRGHTSQQGAGNVGISRYYAIAPTNNSGLNAKLVFHYNDADINGFVEANLRLFRSTDGSTNWTNQAGTVDAALNTVTKTGIDAFSYWTVADLNSPLPIQLATFTATNAGNNTVMVRWRTLSEVNNYGFYVQKRSNGVLEWSDVSNSFVAGHGTTNVPQRYEFTDNVVATGTLSYRLKQVDLDGTTHFSEPIQVDGLTDVKEVAPLQFALQQNYPNPFNPSTEIKFSVEATDHAKLVVFSSLGQNVATLFDDVAEAGHYYKVRFNAGNLSSGVYFYQLRSGKKSDLKKLLLLK